MRKILDRTYNISGAISAGLIALICLLVTAQVVLNLITKIGGTSVSVTISSYSSFAGYFLAASSFLALAYTFMRGGHIRVTLVLNMLKKNRTRYSVEVIALVLSGAISVFTTYYMIVLLEQSYRYGDKSTGIVAIPLWIPQSSVVIGLAIFSIAIIDMLVQTIRNGKATLEHHETL